MISSETQQTNKSGRMGSSSIQYKCSFALAQPERHPKPQHQGVKTRLEAGDAEVLEVELDKVISDMIIRPVLSRKARNETQGE